MELKKIYNQLSRDMDIKNLMSDIPDILTACDEKEGNTLLHWAVLDESFVLAEKLIELGAYPFIYNEDFVTACSLIVRTEQEKLLKMILKRYPNSLSEFPQSELLVSASIAGQHGQLKLMLEAGFNVKNDYRGMSIIEWALQSEQIDVIKLLHQYDAPIDEANDCGYTPLYSASADGLIEIVDYLITVGANVNQQSNDGGTPLMMAVAWNQPKIVEILIQNNADISIKDIENKTALDFAEESQHQEIIEMLKNVL